MMIGYNKFPEVLSFEYLPEIDGQFQAAERDVKKTETNCKQFTKEVDYGTRHGSRP